MRLAAELDLSMIGTLHGLCARICREHPEAAGVAPGFTVLDDEGGSLFESQHLDDILTSLDPDGFGAGGVPFSQAREAVRKLLAEPHLAEAALAVLDRPWEEVEAQWRAAIAARRNEFRASPAWRGPAEAVRNGHWPPGGVLRDKLTVLQTALAELEQGGDFEAGLRRLAGGKLGTAGGAAAADLRRQWNALPIAAEAALKRGIGCDLTEADRAVHTRARIIKRIYDATAAELWARMARAGVLDFAALETGALRALRHDEVRDWYRRRWHVLLLDEAQDVNATQSELIETLVGLFDRPSVCIVGDAKQSIYGFRGAAVEEFGRLNRVVVEDALQGRTITLAQTYRQHAPLAEQLNALFAVILGAQSSPVFSTGQAPHDAERHVELAVVDAPPGIGVGPRRRVEAAWVAERIAQWVDGGLAVSDGDATRPARYGDIAILAKAWVTLDAYAEALAAKGIPAVHAGGGDLLATREALDALAMLRWLAGADDHLALAAVLRGPWFAVSDLTLCDLARRAGERPWWPSLRDEPIEDLARARQVLGELEQAATRELPSALLQRADALTGYSAVLANLPQGARRVADWRGFLDLVRRLEADGPYAFHVARRIKGLLDLEVEIPRPVLQAGNAVSLLTIHSAKGLEYPIVFVPDMARQPPNASGSVRIDRSRGVALGLPGVEGQDKPYLTRVLEEAQRVRDDGEARRLLYVACTRAADRLVLSAAEDAAAATDGESKRWSLLHLLRAGWDALGWPVETIPFDERAATPPLVPAPTPPGPPPEAEICLAAVGLGLHELPAGSLDDYARCPLAFRFEHVEGREAKWTGLGSGAREVGDLVHRALAEGQRGIAALRGIGELGDIEPAMSPELVAQAAERVEAWYTDAAFAPVRGADDRLEVALLWPVGPLLLVGRADRVGVGYVVDYKTGAEVSAEAHRFQVWAYARALDKPEAFVADLRHGELHRFDAARLAALDEEAATLARAIVAGSFEPRPAERHCAVCGYRSLCPAGGATPRREALQ